jgi:hypothetical protein
MVDRRDSYIEAHQAEFIRHPRFYFFDKGVRNALVGSNDLSPERKGVILEHFLYNQIKNSFLARNLRSTFPFFRTRPGLVGRPVHCVGVGLNEPMPRKSKNILICDWRTFRSLQHYQPFS